jgi:hypothetical protein
VIYAARYLKGQSRLRALSNKFLKKGSLSVTSATRRDEVRATFPKAVKYVLHLSVLLTSLLLTGYHQSILPRVRGHALQVITVLDRMIGFIDPSLYSLS